MKHAKFALVVVLFGASCAANAQVHRCIDAAGKASYSDVPCSNSAKKSDRLMGSSATEKRWEPEGYRAQEQLDSINRARGLQQESVDTVTRQSQGEGGAVAIGQRTSPAPVQAAGERDSEPCDTYSNRKGCYGGARGTNPNWSTRRGYHGSGGPADRQYEQEQRQRAASAPGQMVNCDSAGCWGSQNGVRYNRAAGGNLQGTNGSFCTRAGNTFHCN